MGALLVLAACSQKASSAAPPAPAAYVQVTATPGDGGATGVGAEPFECRLHADCGLTRVAEGATCPTLCAPRAVTAAESRRLTGIAARERCPEVSCAPPRGLLVPRCEHGHCTVGTIPGN